MKYLLTIISFILTIQISAQSIKKPAIKKVATAKFPEKLNDSVAALIPIKKAGLFGFQSQAGKIIIAPQYNNVGFFSEDCTILNSPNASVRKFGTKDFASVRKDTIDYRIDAAGKRVYRFKKKDLGKCPTRYIQQLFHAYKLNESYGVIEDSKFQNPADYRQYTIYPQYEYLHIMEGDDLKNPMIVAVHDNKFGVIDIHGKIIIPFQYTDIKSNFSWKLARLFEVSNDGKNYFFVDEKNKAY